MHRLRRAGITTAALGMLAAAAAADRATPSAQLTALCSEYWEDHLQAEPVGATSLGDRRYDDRLSDISAAGRKRRREVLRGFRSRAERIVPEGLSQPERVTRTMLLEVIANDLTVLDCDLVAWLVDPLDGPQVSFFNIPSQQPLRTQEEARAMLTRWRAMGPWIDELIVNLRRGKQEKRVATESQVKSVLDELDALAAKPVDDWALLEPARDLPASWSTAEREQFTKGLRAAVEESVQPALARYRKFLETEILPVARPQDK